ncbi:hypothetical protein F5Y11DRAFT_338891 [Daldinia sp. FL1419]|nr:hypothetical protein F5Y11DRAFT_338891 [Daldinia sp. FL1419]
MYLSKHQLSYSRRLESPLLVEQEAVETIGNNYNWLIIAKKTIRRDLEASKKELELVRDLLSGLRAESKIRESCRGTKDQLFLMRACQEYSGSRSCMLEERLRQMDSWSSDAHMGRSIPRGVPDEYVVSRREEPRPIYIYRYIYIYPYKPSSTFRIVFDITWKSEPANPFT